MVDGLLRRGVGAVQAQIERVLGAGFDPPDPVMPPTQAFGPMPTVGGGFGAPPQVGADPWQSSGIQVREQPFGVPQLGQGNPFGTLAPTGGNPFGAGPTGVYDPFGSIPRAPSTAAPVSAPGGMSTATPGAQGSWGAHEAYRDLYTRVAREMGLDPDEVAAFAQIETPNANPQARSHAGAMGLLQVMPFHFGSGQNPYDPETNVRVGLAYYKQMRDQFGPGLAAAAYHGGPGAIVNGQARNDNSDGYMTSAQYVEQWWKNYNTIKATAPQQQPTGGGQARVSSMFGGQNYAVSQEFGRTDYSTGPGAGVYDFGTEFGLDGDSHTGWDVATPRGTAFHMPAGLSGTVTIAGGSGFYTTSGGDGPGRGELRIRLDNGMELILGHNDRIDVRVGQRVTAGMLLGLTGSSDGDHLHIEVRQYTPGRTRSGWSIVNPAILFGGG